MSKGHKKRKSAATKRPSKKAVAQTMLEVVRKHEIAAEAAEPIKQTGSWELARLSMRLWWSHWQICMLVLLLPTIGLITGISLLGDYKTAGPNALAGAVLTLVSVIWAVINLPAAYYLQTALAVGEQPRLWDCYRRGYRSILQMIGLTLLVGILIFGGLLLFIVPGVLAMRRYGLAVFYLYDDKNGSLGIRQAMERCAADSKPVAKYIFGAVGVYVACNVIILSLFSGFPKPYGQIASTLLTSTISLVLVLRYREIARRKPAGELFND